MYLTLAVFKPTANFNSMPTVQYVGGNLIQVINYVWAHDNYYGTFVSTNGTAP